MGIPYPDLDRLLHSLILRLILEINRNKYRTFRGDGKMYGPIPHSNETDRLYIHSDKLRYTVGKQTCGGNQCPDSISVVLAVVCIPRTLSQY